MSEGTRVLSRAASDSPRVVVRTLAGPSGRDGEVTLARLATELEPYAEDVDLAQHAARTTAVHGITVDTTLGTRVFLGGRMVYGDTGYRVLFTPTRPPEWGEVASGNQLAVRRIGSTVWLSIRGFRPGPDQTPRHITRLPVGFRPDYSTSNNPIPNNDNVSAPNMRVSVIGASSANHGVINVEQQPSPGRHYGQFQFTTADPWPESLPGSPG